MEIQSISSVVGWFNDKMRIEKRKIYHHENGNNVVVVERRDIDVVLYNKKGEILEPEKIGSNVDRKS